MAQNSKFLGDTLKMAEELFLDLMDDRVNCCLNENNGYEKLFLRDI